MNLGMEEAKHACKVCSKRFPCGRSLGGHMRSHLITISSSSSKSPNKKLLSLSNPMEMDQSPPQKSCKECGKAFQSWKALFGHMKCHSVNRICLDEDSWNSCSDHHKDSQSDNEAATVSLWRRKRSDRMMMTRYTATTASSSLTAAYPASVMDQHEQEEVALSLIILSRDKGEWGGFNLSLESSDNSLDISEPNKIKKTLHSLKKLRSTKQLEVNALQDEAHEIEFEVVSPKKLIKSRDHDHFEAGEGKKSSSRKRKAAITSHELEKSSKFTCSMCKKAFQSYQALGGHRASHKKFKGCCVPTSDENSLETENSHNQSENPTRAYAEKAEIGCKKTKDHECPICFKVFPSGQALGGHKRSHLIMDQAKKNTPTPTETEIPTREIRDYLDLNLPAPAEEECNEFKPWWIHAGRNQQPPPLLGLLSS